MHQPLHDRYSDDGITVTAWAFTQAVMLRVQEIQGDYGREA
jgi:hypothetical protein